MPAIERIGELAIKALEKLYYYALGLIIKLIHLHRNLQQWDREKLFPLFKGKSMRDYMILKLQLSSFIFFIAVVGNAFGFLPFSVAFPVALLTGSYSIYSMFSQMEGYIGKEYPAYRDFFLGYLVISVLIFIFNLGIEERGLLRYVYLIFFTLILVGIFSFIFKQRYSRDYTLGVVEESGIRAMVRCGYDLLSGVKAGNYTVPNAIKAQKGERVKLRVERGFLNFRGAKPVEIEEVVEGTVAFSSDR